jgi:hypothetical protein
MDISSFITGSALVAVLSWLATKSKRDADIMIFICKTLQDDGARKKRRKVLRELSQKPWTEWSSDERDIAEEVAMQFDISMKVAKRSLWARNTLVSDWARPAVLCWRVIYPLIEARRAVAPRNLWHDFGELQQRAADEYPSLWTDPIGPILNFAESPSEEESE